MADYLVLNLDVSDPDLMSAFWCAALGYELVGGVGQYRALEHPTGQVPKMLLQHVPEPKTTKNRLHLDLHVTDIDAEAARLEAAGAIRVQRVDEFGISWIVMHDPEGNEFCVVPS